MAYFDSCETVEGSTDYLELRPITRLLIAATFVDPRYKNAYCKTDLIAKLAYHLLFLHGHCLNNPDDISPPTSQAGASITTSMPGPTVAPNPKRCKSALGSCVNHASTSVAFPPTSIRARIDAEISMYVMMPPAVDE